MPRTPSAAVLSLALVAAAFPSFGEKLNLVNKEAVERRLISHFPLTQFDPYRGPGRVGAIVELLRPGLESSPAAGAIIPAISYKNGILRRTAATALLGQLLPLPPGTRLFITKIEAKEGYVLFDLVTTAPLNGVFFKAAVHFEFGKGFLDSPDFTRIELTANEVFALDRGPSQPEPGRQPSYRPPPSYTQQPSYPQKPSYPQQQQQPSYPTPSEPPPPPAPPTASGSASPQPVDLRLGMTADQVRAAMGKPSQIVRLGPKQIFVYQGAKVTLVDGKVTNIE